MSLYKNTQIVWNKARRSYVKWITTRARSFRYRLCSEPENEALHYGQGLYCYYRIIIRFSSTVKSGWLIIFRRKHLARALSGLTTLRRRSGRSSGFVGNKGERRVL